jgi:hypothetical protein
MTWDDYNRRRAALKSVLAYAEKNPSDGLPFEQLPEVRAEFRDRRELLLALQYDWSQALWARIELLSLEHGRRNCALTDADDLAGRAWADSAARHPVLRRLLDTYRDELGPSSREKDMLAVAPFVA